MKRSIFIALFLISNFSLAEEVVKSEIEMHTEHIGINIEKLTQAALKGEGAALEIYLALNLDGGGGEIFHEYDRPMILRKIPDVRLAEALGVFSLNTIIKLERELVHGLSPEELDALKHRMPKTFAIIKTETKRPNKP
ncbi:MAG: hypothetical protein WCK77_25155 [Verrucomicrobiota bacterium]